MLTYNYVVMLILLCSYAYILVCSYAYIQLCSYAYTIM